MIGRSSCGLWRGDILKPREETTTGGIVVMFFHGHGHEDGDEVGDRAGTDLCIDPGLSPMGSGCAVRLNADIILNREWEQPPTERTTVSSHRHPRVAEQSRVRCRLSESEGNIGGLFVMSAYARGVSRGNVNALCKRGHSTTSFPVTGNSPYIGRMSRRRMPQSHLAQTQQSR